TSDHAARSLRECDALRQCQFPYRRSCWNVSTKKCVSRTTCAPPAQGASPAAVGVLRRWVSLKTIDPRYTALHPRPCEPQPSDDVPAVYSLHPCGGPCAPRPPANLKPACDDIGTTHVPRTCRPCTRVPPPAAVRKRIP